MHQKQLFDPWNTKNFECKKYCDARDRHDYSDLLFGLAKKKKNNNNRGKK